MCNYTANSLLFLLHSTDYRNFTSGKRLHIKSASARNCGFLVHPSNSESTSQSQHCRAVVIWNCILLLVIENVAPLVPLKTFSVTIMALEPHSSDSKSIYLCVSSFYGSHPTGMRLLELKKNLHTSVPQFFLSDPFLCLMAHQKFHSHIHLKSCLI